jgi:hypothetical protein
LTRKDLLVYIIITQLFGYGTLTILSDFIGLSHNLLNYGFRGFQLILVFIYFIGFKFIYNRRSTFFLIFLLLLGLRLFFELDNPNLYQPKNIFYTYFWVFNFLINTPLIFSNLKFKEILPDLIKISIFFILLSLIYVFFEYQSGFRLSIVDGENIKFNPIGWSRLLLFSIVFLLLNKKKIGLIGIIPMLLTGTRISIAALSALFVFNNKSKYKFVIVTLLIILISPFLIEYAQNLLIYERITSRELDQEIRLIQWLSILPHLSETWLYGYGMFDFEFGHLFHNLFIEAYGLLGILSLLFLYNYYRNSSIPRSISILIIVFGLTGLSLIMNPEIMSLLIIGYNGNRS